MYNSLSTLRIRICIKSYAEGKKYNDAYVTLNSDQKGVMEFIVGLEHVNESEVPILMRN